MLSTSPIIAFIPTRDSARARAFYAETLGLRFVSEDNFALVFDANGTMLRIVCAGDFTPFQFTLLGWQVSDIDTAVADLTARGVQFLRYDFLEQAPNGVWTAPGNAARIAWFRDPDDNTLSISQHAYPA
ncbi:MAG TPA: VOC family protein [Acidobacteriaceae bacterium]|nr:VOC family protein [Acidobacteriaceae bacterium]